MSSWIKGLEESDITTNLQAFGYNKSQKFGNNKATYRLRTYTHVLNATGYVLSIFIGLIRLVTALCVYIQAKCYTTNDDASKNAQKMALKFAKKMAIRGLIELTLVGGLIATPILDSCQDQP